ncbi:hypothetical protein [Stenotrophomonas sp. SY1]|uniref:hypothetical protein n=1 Tax=Stenotrophomonas sp. SY1 TaxID=477235 RepID=UPI001E462FC3|nr:hypothetical protein [Stenotrophomonas sp. SY1]MCD9087253.1 hypothetical protein [Stenotrophomonas sp. SY1]
MDAWVGLSLMGAAVVLLLLPFESANLRRRAALEQRRLGRGRAMWVALLGIVTSCSLALLCFWLVMFGPSLVVGDITVLPWITFIPALIAALWVARASSRWMVAAAFKRLPPC